MIIIIGAGLAGYQLAREIRKLNQDTPLMMITADDGRFYSKPLLSTAFTQKKTAESLATATAESMSTQLKAAIRTHCEVTSVDPNAQTVSIGDEKIAYTKLVLACGADVIRAPLSGDAVADVLSINHLYHYSAFQNLIKHKKSIAILGAGLIGCEFANDLSNAGYEVHVIAPVTAPLNLLGPEKIGLILQAALEKNGVVFHLNCVAHRVDKFNNHYKLTLSNGQFLETDFILSAIGLRPHIALAEDAGIQTNRGIVLNRYLESSALDIYALGDCAEVEGHVLPYITPLLNCSRALAKTVLGERTAVDYPAMPVTVKTPAHPIVICPPPSAVEGNWEIEILDNTVRALFFNSEKQLCGFVLTNDAVKERLQLVKQIPGLFDTISP